MADEKPLKEIECAGHRLRIAKLRAIEDDGHAIYLRLVQSLVPVFRTLAKMPDTGEADETILLTVAEWVGSLDLGLYRDCVRAFRTRTEVYDATTEKWLPVGEKTFDAIFTDNYGAMTLWFIRCVAHSYLSFFDEASIETIVSKARQAALQALTAQRRSQKGSTGSSGK